MTPAASIVSIQIGAVAPLGPNGVASAFVKTPVAGPVAVGALGVAGDHQADPRVHGGPDKAVYLYPVEHYARWRALYPTHAALLEPGGFGENLTVRGLDEADMHAGDILRVGTATVQVTDPRQPCFKLALRFADRTMGRAMLKTGMTGWYARVLEPGTIAAGDAIVLVERHDAEPTIARLARAEA